MYIICSRNEKKCVHVNEFITGECVHYNMARRGHIDEGKNGDKDGLYFGFIQTRPQKIWSGLGQLS